MLKRTCSSLTLAALLLGLSGLPSYAQAQESSEVSLERAEGPKLSSALGHYARARSLLVAALREFDRGNRMVDPSAVLNVEAWRNTLIDRAEDLERVLAPQARATRSGVRFEPDSRLLGQISEAEPKDEQR